MNITNNKVDLKLANASTTPADQNIIVPTLTLSQQSSSEIHFTVAQSSLFNALTHSNDLNKIVC